jgi:DNA-binding Lrp family transcriptional regulator
MTGKVRLVTDDRTRDDDSGRFSEEIDREELLKPLRAADQPLPTRTIADAAGISTRQALRRLHSLADEGVVAAIDAGHAYVWQLTDSV